ncbi:MAG: PilZ domain-containing protein [Alphaproteobacteria bacterium]|nr:PilZ domain-containing protein [Alphaproteobacteria bacterium]
MKKDANKQSGAHDATSRSTDRRKHKRSPLKLGVRFLIADGTEHTGTVTDISLGGMAIQTDAEPDQGSIVIAYVEGFGRLEGMVARLNNKGFAVHLTLSAIKREKLEERLSTNKKTAPQEGRRHERETTSAATRIVRADGRELPCRVIDLSLGGVSVETAEWPALGEQVMVGKMRGRVVRHHELGIAIEFTDIPPSRGSLAEQLVAADRSAAA